MNILNLFRRHRVPRETPPSESGHFEIVLSGSGGQGIVLAGKILAKAAAIYDQKEAVMSISYGPEARGGASRAEVIISSAKIDYPKVMHTDILLTLTQEALDRYGDLLAPEGLLIADETFVEQIPPRFANVFKAPFCALALKLLDAPIVANIIALGALVAITGVVSKEALIRAVLEHAPEKVLISDRLSVDMGFKAVRDSGFQWRGK
ncbi:MAG: 2-oxoacid:acceptor oxidoreductase family protein [Candidatus Omnitrophota bacterium]|nr:2-oxoacid:acceptor oxidoreductase family protein [Candidatus Omnitrophota bacterium]